MTTYPSGISFPFRFSNAGGIQKSQGGKKIMTNLKALIRSALRERLVRKSVGTVGYEEVLRSSTHMRSNAIEGLVREAIIRFEPRATDVKVKVYTEDMRDGYHVFADVSFIFSLTRDPIHETFQLD